MIKPAIIQGMKIHGYAEFSRVKKAAEKKGHTPVAIVDGLGCYKCQAEAKISKGSYPHFWLAVGALLDEGCTTASVSDSDRVSAALALSSDPRTK